MEQPATMSRNAPVKIKQIRKSRDARSAEIIEAAAKIFMQDGYALFSLRAVANQVGIRLSSLQHHFPTREILLTATIDSILTDWNARFLEIAARRELPVIDRLQLIFQHNLDLILEMPAATLLLELLALAQHEEFALRFAQDGYLQFRHIFTGLLRELRPDLSDDQLMAHATIIASQMEGLMIFVRPDDPARLPSEVLRSALDVFARACIDAVTRQDPD